ncbi:MAG: ECF transporter S component [Clostridia bacterium]|nr:ECF transporter S component [Clostridia bacterium]
MTKTKRIVITGLCMALGVMLPVAVHSIPNAGNILLPMHIPVLLCGLMCGPWYGLACGILTPVASSLISGMPPMAYLPPMIAELAAYGLISGLCIRLIGCKNRTVRVYLSLIAAMIAGRIAYGMMNALIFRAGEYSMELWLGATFITAAPGILAQLIVIPVIILALEKAKVIDTGKQHGGI